ncbi:SpvB/TcaC N-terminal domain-containing protein [uncultured Psychrobacter sp.]|uniref:SpvB/TcaC N-terminal domain-containing protein n=1 Tax=uncultured Psychrobacter sp. TaxID=259303 RepID=UPI003459A1A5
MSDISSNISLPKGGGAIAGLGETFSPDLFTGTGNFSVPIDVPPGRNGFQPQLSLVYSTGNDGISPFGLGWQLTIPGVSRKTSKGIPRYLGEDTFILSGAEDLVAIQKDKGITQYRPRTEGLFAKIFRHLDANNDYWQVRSKEGLTSYYGNQKSRKSDAATIADPQNNNNIFVWKLTNTVDTFGNQIRYKYFDDSDEDYTQSYLHEILYLNYGADLNDNNPAFLLTIRFNYEDLPEQKNIYPSSDHRAGFEVRTAKRCSSIEIYSNPDALPQDKLTTSQLTRSYHLKYIDQLSLEQQQAQNIKPPQNGLSYLHQIEVVGHDNGKTETLPAPQFSYSTFDPEQRKFSPLDSKNLPTQSLTDPDLELIDLFGNGLPDILETKGVIRYWRNLGNGNFDMPRQMKEAPTALSLSTAGVQVLDANGDGRPDLMVCNNRMNGYFSSEAGALWDRRSFQPYRTAPSFSLQDPQVKLIDLNGDGITDALRSGSRFELFYNDSDKGWSSTQQVSRKALKYFPNVSFTDPRIKWADMSGDGLTDIVMVHDGNIEYWPYQGYGKWGRRVHMHNSPRLPYGYDSQRLYLGDIDGSGNADLIYIDHSKVTLWLNQAGKGWSEPIVINGTPPVTNPAAIRLVDLYGSGVSGLLWTDNKSGARHHYYFLDFTGGVKPYLLNEMDNRLGALTRVYYESSIRFYLADEKSSNTRWQSTLPFPVQVVSKVESIDLISQGKLTTEYSYHHGYWDGKEREFRGFGRVDQRDTESFDNYHKYTSDSELAFLDIDYSYFSAPTEIRSWFHQGPVRKKEGHWSSSDFRHEYWAGDPGQLDGLYDQESFLKTLQLQDRRDAIRTLRGTLLRSETYALDGNVREAIPYTVSESAFELKEIAVPTQVESNRQSIYFPFSVASRTTQWERGDEPMTQFSFTSDYDDYGQPQRSWQVACPKGWIDKFSQTENYLATFVQSSFAQRDDEHVYIVDRLAESKRYELLIPTPQTLLQIKQAVESEQINKQLIGHSLNFYDGNKYTGLALGKIGEHGVLSRSESLVLTQETLNHIYDNQIPDVFAKNGQPNWSSEYPQPFIDSLPVDSSRDVTRPNLIITSLGYGFADGLTPPYTHGYYAAGQRQEINARGMVTTSVNPFGSESHIEYDQYDFLPIKATNPRGLTIQAEYDYRTSQIALMIDANGNQSQASYSPLGMLQSIQVNAKAGENIGDRVEQPSIRYRYDFNAFVDSQKQGQNPQPVYVHTLQRTEHAWQLIDEENDKRAAANLAEMTESEITDFFDNEEDKYPERFIQIREYSDGFGRQIQTRVQAAETRFGDNNFGHSGLPANQSDEQITKQIVTGTVNRAKSQPNVIVSGWQTFNNKGSVVEQYEPFYHVGWDYLDRNEHQAQNDKHGKAAKMFYDPRGQVIRTLNPNGSEQRVIYGIPKRLDSPEDFIPSPWQAYTYDANDNAGRTHFNESQNYQNHWDTPAHIERDALGRTIKVVERLKSSNDPVDWIVTKSRYDILGNLLEVTDALGRIAFKYSYSLIPESSPLRIDSIDAGIRQIITDAVGQEVERRDSKGALVLQSYDLLLRPKYFWARNTEQGDITLRQRTHYGDDNVADFDVAKISNTLGQLTKHYDEAGSVSTSGFDFKGNPLDNTRQVIAEQHLLSPYDNAANNNWDIKPFQVNWQAPAGISEEDHTNSLLNPFQYTSSSRFDALNRATEIVYPEDVTGKRAKLIPYYNRSGALESVALDNETYVERIAYNAKGQRILIAYGNGALTRYSYDDNTFRLNRLRTEHFDVNIHASNSSAYKPTGKVLQDFAYQYDLNGNILKIADRSPECGVHNPALNIDELDRLFQYDPLSRLTSATGRESDRSLSTPDGPELPHHNDVTKTRAYTQSYQYDKMGNMQLLKHTHVTNRGNVVSNRDFTVEANNNRLEQVSFSGTEFSYVYDDNGNMISEGLARHFEWNHSDQLIVFRTQTGNSEPRVYAQYLYDASGLRVMKLVRKQGGGWESRVYIGELFEHFRWDNSGASPKENNVLHIMDDQQRIVLVRRGEAHQNDAGPAVQFHLSDHLGSSNLVLDAAGELMNREEHYPYGETSFGSFARKRYRFTGKERDEESDLNYHAARYYSVSTVRWISCDPIGLAGGVNVYSYVSNKPILMTDPNGTYQGMPIAMGGDVNEGSVGGTENVRIEENNRLSSEEHLDQVRRIESPYVKLQYMLVNNIIDQSQFDKANKALENQSQEESRQKEITREIKSFLLQEQQEVMIDDGSVMKRKDVSKYKALRSLLNEGEAIRGNVGSAMGYISTNSVGFGIVADVLEISEGTREKIKRDSVHIGGATFNIATMSPRVASPHNLLPGRFVSNTKGANYTQRPPPKPVKKLSSSPLVSKSSTNLLNKSRTNNVTEKKISTTKKLLIGAAFGLGLYLGYRAGSKNK